MAGKLWDKGYEPDKMIEEYTVGDDRELDMRLARYDVEGSLAHIAMLETIGLLTAEELEKLTAGLKEIAAATGVPYQSFHQLLYLNCAGDLYALYRQRGLDDEIFYTTMYDLRCKLIECREVYGLWGNATDGWSDGFFKLDRFALGRLQYERRTCPHEDYVCGDVVLRQGEPVLNTHIPSAGPFPRALRYDSYRRAYEFYPEIRCGGKYLPIICDSWLLFPEHERFLPKSSNILDFMRDFDIIQSSYSEQPHAWWRIFGRYFNVPFDRLPRDTSLRRAYADWLVAGNNTGSGAGLLLFDGEKIVNNARGE